MRAVETPILEVCCRAAVGRVNGIRKTARAKPASLSEKSAVSSCEKRVVCLVLPSYFLSSRRIFLRSSFEWRNIGDIRAHFLHLICIGSPLGWGWLVLPSDLGGKKKKRKKKWSSHQRIFLKFCFLDEVVPATEDLGYGKWRLLRTIVSLSVCVCFYSGRVEVTWTALLFLWVPRFLKSCLEDVAEVDNGHDDGGDIHREWYSVGTGRV